MWYIMSSMLYGIAMSHWGNGVGSAVPPLSFFGQNNARCVGMRHGGFFVASGRLPEDSRGAVSGAKRAQEGFLFKERPKDGGGTVAGAKGPQKTALSKKAFLQDLPEGRGRGLVTQ